jgi:hypothetical protein
MAIRTGHRLLYRAAVVGAAGVLAVLPAVPAQASANGDYTASGVRIRACANTSCTTHGLGYRGQGATITCFRYGQYVEGTSIWYYHRNQTTGVTGYSISRYLDFTSGTVPHC